MTPDAGTSVHHRSTANHRAMWASGDHRAFAAELVPDLGEELVAAAGIGAGQRVLDVEAGLTPELLERGGWGGADAEGLPFPTGGFDVVVSCVGVTSAPPRAAGELLRVCRPGGTIALVTWAPGGFIGGLFAVMARSAPPGAPPPPPRGGEQYVRELFGDGVTTLAVRRRIAVFDRCATPLEFREFWKRTHRPTIAVYAANAGEPERLAALDSAFLEHLESWNVAPVGRPVRWEAQYLLVTATRA
jgi:SAM-dependent methyltransferase